MSSSFAIEDLIGLDITGSDTSVIIRVPWKPKSHKMTGYDKWAWLVQKLLT